MTTAEQRTQGGRWSRMSAITLATLSLTVVAGSAVLLLKAGASVAHLTGDATLDFVAVTSYLPHIFAGLFLTWRLPRHPIGWLLLVAAFAVSLQNLAGRAIIYTHVVRDDPTVLTEVLAVVGDSFWIPGVAMGLVGLLILYPDGRPPTRWSTWTLWMMGVTAAGYLMVTLFARAPLYFLESVPNPMGVIGDRDLFEFGQSAAILPMLLVGLPAGIATLIARWRRSDTAERHQIKWLIWAAVVQVLAIGTSIVGSEMIEGPVQGGWTGALTDIGGIALPVAIVVAITRHGLFEIDRIIARTVSYALVVGLLGLLFLALVTLSATFVPSDEPLVVAAATLAVFALFNPIRRRVQSMVGRRFNRARYDAERVVAEFTGTLQDRADPEGVVEDWLGVVEETMEPATVGIWMRDGS